MPRMNPGNGGPVDDRRPEDRVIVTFENVLQKPSFFINRQREPTISTADLTAYTSQQLAHSHVMPPGSQNPDREGMIKIYFPEKLKPRFDRDPQPFDGRVWHSLHEYKGVLADATPEKQRKAGVYIETRHGKIDNYRVVMEGNNYQVRANTPKAIARLMQDMGAVQTDIPAQIRADVKPTYVLFEKNRPYTEWKPLEDHGFVSSDAPIPEPVLNRIRGRFRLRGKDTSAHQLNFTMEYVVLPEGLTWNDQLKLRLDNSKVPTFELWRCNEIVVWHEAFPHIPGTFSVRDPIPAVAETGANPDEVKLCSEWHRRRTVFDVIVQATSGSTHNTLEEHYAWLNSSNTVGPSGELPVLFLPQVPTEVATIDLTQTSSSQESDDDDDAEPNTSDDSSVEMEIVSIQTFPADDSTSEQEQVPPPNEFLTFKPVKVEQDPMKDQNIKTEVKIENEDKPIIRKKGLVATALGKYDPGPNVHLPLLTQHFKETLPGISENEAAILTRLTAASTAKTTTRVQRSVQKVVLKLFPERPDIFVNTQTGDQMRILVKLIQAGYKPTTVKAYVRAYDNLVIINGGVPPPRLPQQAKIMTGLNNIGHNPAQKISSSTARQAYSLESLNLVAKLGVHLMKKTNKWSDHRAALYRATITTLFFGRLRSNEALNGNNHEFDVRSSLLGGDVILEPEKHRALILLRSAKYQEEQGALVIIPSTGKANCPIKALMKYAQLRDEITTNKNVPFFLTETRWEHGQSRADDEAGIYTSHRFRKDTEEVVRVLIKQYPKLKDVMDHLVTHSLRAGIPTELQDAHLDEEVRRQLGRWHSTAAAVYMKNFKDATDTAAIIEKTLLDIAGKESAI